jgi:hypothetical protein
MENRAQIAEIEKRGVSPSEACEKRKGWFILTLICVESLPSQMLFAASGEHSNIDNRLLLSSRPLRNKIAERRNAACV